MRLEHEFTMSHLMGIRPWEHEHMTVDQMDRAFLYCEAHERAQQQAREV